MTYKVIINGRTHSAPLDIHQAAHEIAEAYRTDQHARVTLRVYLTRTSDRPATEEEQQEVINEAVKLL
jgi:hypothetical protein